jgi:hypothetical protein
MKCNVDRRAGRLDDKRRKRLVLIWFTSSSGVSRSVVALLSVLVQRLDVAGPARGARLIGWSRGHDAANPQAIGLRFQWSSSRDRGSPSAIDGGARRRISDVHRTPAGPEYAPHLPSPLPPSEASR